MKIITVISEITKFVVSKTLELRIVCYILIEIFIEHDVLAILVVI